MKAIETEELLKKFKSKLLEKFPGGIHLIHLFGSVAQGKASRASDIDILLVVKKKDQVIDFIDDFVFKTILQGGPYLSVKLYDEKEYKRLITPPTFFMREIHSQGRKL